MYVTKTMVATILPPCRLLNRPMRQKIINSGIIFLCKRPTNYKIAEQTHSVWLSAQYLLRL